MNRELKRDITELLRGRNRDWDQMNKVLSQITEEQFVQMGLVGIFNQIAEQFRMSQGAVSNAQKYPWVNKYINLKRYSGGVYKQLLPLTLPELIVNMRVHEYKDVSGILEDTLFKCYIKGDHDITPHVEDLVTILDSISTKERKGVYYSLTIGITSYIGNSRHRMNVLDANTQAFRNKENYKKITKLIGEALDRNASGPLSGGDIIVDYYYQEYPHFIGWTIPLNTILKDIMEYGFEEGIQKYKLTKAQCIAITWSQFINKEDGQMKFLLDSDLSTRWVEFFELNGGMSRLYDLFTEIDTNLKEKKTTRESKGKKERTEGIGIDLVTPKYRVVRVNYASKAKIVDYVKLHDEIQIAYKSYGVFKLIINGTESELSLSETDLYNSFNIRTNTKCIYDLEEIL